MPPLIRLPVCLLIQSFHYIAPIGPGLCPYKSHYFVDTKAHRKTKREQYEAE